MRLIIVESPTKARTLSGFLGKGYEVLATVGHIKDLPKSKLGVDVEKEFSPDYVDAMWRMLGQEEPRDIVLATGETHTVREFVNEAFRQVDLDPSEYVRVDDQLFRPAEVHELRGDPSKAKDLLAWTAQVRFQELVKIMVEADLERTAQQAKTRPILPVT